MQVGRGDTQVEGVSYVHRILAVITPHNCLTICTILYK